MASTTSLTVDPGVMERMARMSSSSNVTASTTRWADTAALKRVRGTWAGGGAALWAAAAWRRRLAMSVAVQVSRTRHGWVAAFQPARASSSAGEGSVSPRHGSTGGRGGGASGVRSWVATPMSVPDAPSTAAWWTLLRIPKQPGGYPLTRSRPSMTYISHSGLPRSSGRLMSRAHWMHSCRQSPGSGSAI